MSRKSYPKEFKEEAVRLSYAEGISAAQVAKNLGIDKQLIYKWRMEFKPEDDNDKPLNNKEREELKRLRKENKRIKLEREILKKAVSIFSEEE
jgi:transposase